MDHTDFDGLARGLPNLSSAEMDVNENMGIYTLDTGLRPEPREQRIR